MIEEQFGNTNNNKGAYVKLAEIAALINKVETTKLFKQNFKTFSCEQACAVLVLCLKTRPEWNVNNQALAQVEESGELGDFSGMI